MGHDGGNLQKSALDGSGEKKQNKCFSNCILTIYLLIYIYIKSSVRRLYIYIYLLLEELGREDQTQEAHKKL